MDNRIPTFHCNAAHAAAQGTEVECFGGGAGEQLAKCIQSQIVDSLGTIDRGVKYMPKLLVLRYNRQAERGCGNGAGLE